MVNWREAEVNYLIDLIRCHTFIWDTSLTDYKKKHKKFKFWGFAAYKINAAFNPPIPFDRKDCFKKWNNLRTYFQTEMKSLKTRSGVDSLDAKGIICNGWKYSSKMSFLIDSHLPNASENTFNNSDNSTFDAGGSLSDSYDDSEMESYDPTLLMETSQQQRPNVSMDNKCESFSENQYKKCESSPDTHYNKYKNETADTSGDSLPYKLSGVMTQQLHNKQESPSYFYGRYVGQCLDKLDADLHLDARQKINEILFNCERAQLIRQ